MTAGRLLAGLTSTTLVQLRIAWVILESRGGLMLESADNQRRFSGTEGGTYPFFSPDGQWIGFFADGKMKKISVQGGAPVTLCPTPATGTQPRLEVIAPARFRYSRLK